MKPCPGCGHELTTVGCANPRCGNDFFPGGETSKWGCAERPVERDPATVERERIVKIVTEVLDDYDDGALILAEILRMIG